MSLLAAPITMSSTTAASTALQRVGRYVEMLAAALRDDPRFYAQLVRRGFLENAIEHARFARDACAAGGILEFDDGIVEVLLEARDIGTPAGADPDLVGALNAAGAAAAAAVMALATLRERES